MIDRLGRVRPPCAGWWRIAGLFSLMLAAGAAVYKIHREQVRKPPSRPTRMRFEGGDQCRGDKAPRPRREDEGGVGTDTSTKENRCIDDEQLALDQPPDREPFVLECKGLNKSSALPGKNTSESKARQQNITIFGSPRQSCFA